MHAGFLHVLHHRADHDVAGRVPDGVHVHLGGVLQEAVDQHGPLGRQPALPAEGAETGQLGHGPAEAVLVVHDLHRPPPEHVAGAHQGRIADPLDDGKRVGDGRRGAAGRLRDLEPGAQRVPVLPVLGQVDRLGAGAEDEAGRKHPGQLQRRLAAEADDDAGRALRLDDVQHVLLGQRLEVETVARVVVGRDRLRVAVDHHRLVAGVAEGEAGVHAAVVELDALADAVRP